jgi:hypothetical protein
MTQIAQSLGHVMMTAVSFLTQNNKPNHNDIRRWCEVEYKGDPYAYYCLMNGIKPNNK